MNTYLPKQEDIEQKWWVVDAENATVGRLATRIAEILRGKNKVTYTPHLDCGDYVIVVNAEKAAFTGRKETRKVYQDYSGYMGGLKETRVAEMRQHAPEQIIRRAVWGMMPKGRLGRKQVQKLKIYAGPDHPHEAQKPEQLQP